MKYAGKPAPKPRYKIGTRVYVTGLPKHPMGRVTLAVSVVGHTKTVRMANVKKTKTGWYYEWYRRSDNNYAPALRDYDRDEGTFALNRPSKSRRRKFEGDAALKAKKGQRVQRTKRYG